MSTIIEEPDAENARLARAYDELEANADAFEEQVIRFPDDPADYTVDDHMIEATAQAREAVEAYWQKMEARPSLADFEVGVAEHYVDVARDASDRP